MLIFFNRMLYSTLDKSGLDILNITLNAKKKMKFKN